jgi:hypothetical protein
MLLSGEEIKLCSNIFVKGGADPGVVGPEAYTILGALCTEKNAKT